MIEQHPSPQSSPEVNVTNNLKSEVEDHMTSGSQVISVNQSSGVEEEVDIPEPDEAEVSPNNLKSEVEDHMTSGSQVISVNQSSGVEEEVDIPEPDEAEVSLNPLYTNGFLLLV